MSTSIEFNNISKQYRLGLVSTRTLSHDLNRWWAMNIRGKEDPYLKIGSVNDRASAADSEYVWALKDIDFKVEQGDVVGIIGKNGAGKSTLLKLLSKVTAPTTGTIKARGRIGALLEVGTGFHPEMTGRENIYMNGAIMGMTKQEITRKLDEIVDFSGCERYIDTPVKRYSSGMTVRLGFAVAAHLEPEILVVDEVLAVGDAEFQKKAIGKMQDVSRGEGRTVLFVSHNMASMQRLCTRGVLLDKGMVKYMGGISDTIETYLKVNDFKKASMLDFIKYKSNLVSISQCKINGGDENLVEVGDNNKDICINISGTCPSDTRISLEAQLLDSNQTLLASYCPCHTEGKIHHFESGEFTFEEVIRLPQNMTAGDFYLRIQLTDPGVAYYCSFTQPIKIRSLGYTGSFGVNLPYSERGLLLL